MKFNLKGTKVPNDRAKKIMDLLEKEERPSYVEVMIHGKIKCIPKKIYEISQYGAQIQPFIYGERYTIDEYNNGPFRKVVESKARTPELISSSTGMLGERKTRKAEKIINSKNPKYDRKIIVKIKLFPMSYPPIDKEKLYCRYEEAVKWCGDFEWYPKAIDCLTVDTTPRELAAAGIYYKDLDWGLVKEEEKGSAFDSEKQKEQSSLVRQIRVNVNNQPSTQGKANTAERKSSRSDEGR